MRNLTLFLISLLSLYSCKKDGVGGLNNRIPGKVDEYLKAGLASFDYDELNISAATVVKYDSVGANVWRVPFVDRSAETDFVLIKADKSDACIAGRIVHIDRDEADKTEFNGSIEIGTLRRTSILSSSINQGFITALHRSRQPIVTGIVLQAPVIPASAFAEVLPECIVVAALHPQTGDESYSVYVRILSLINDASDDSGGSAGGGSSGGQGGSGTATGASSGIYDNSYTPLTPSGAGVTAPIIRIDSEDGTENPPISVAAYIKCFGSIPDNENTSYSITIMSDIPVDNDPNDLFSFLTTSPGHTFLAFTKQNGAQSITQNIGFYPNGSLKSVVSCDPIPGKFVDNQFHEFNASLQMGVTGSKFQDALNVLGNMANAKYDIDQLNCTDMALQSFNAGRTGTPLTIPLYHIPGSPVQKSNTPQGLYFELNSMKMTFTPEAGNIIAGSAKHYASVSHGPCN